MHQFGFSVWKKLSIGALPSGLALRLMGGVIPAAFSVAWWSPQAYWMPRSECWMRPAPGRWRWVAISSADIASSARSLSGRDRQA